MRFLVADTFTRSIARLDGGARRIVQCAAFGFQMNPSQPGLRLHRLVHARDPGFWSLSVNKDLRIIVHRDPSDVVFCYADHHDKAYAWAERRKLGRHPESGALSFVEVAEPARDVAAAPGPGLERLPLEGRRPREGVPLEAPARVVDLQRRLRTRARAAAPLPVRPSTSASDVDGRPLAQLLQLAQRLGRVAVAPSVQRTPHGTPGLASSPNRGEAAPDHGVPVHAKILALALLAAPWPLLASVVVSGAAGGSTGGRAVLALAPGIAGSLLLASTGLLAAYLVRAAARRAVRESERIRDGVRSGDLGVRCDPRGVDPALRPILRTAQEAVEAFSEPFEEGTAVLARVARGEIPEALARSYGGEFERQHDAINAIVGFVQLRAADIHAIIGGVSGRGREPDGETIRVRGGPDAAPVLEAPGVASSIPDGA